MSETVAIFDTPQAAAAAVTKSSGLGDCLIKVINTGGLDTKDAAFSFATFGPVSFPPFGDQTQSYRVTFHVKVKGQTGLGSEGDAYIDLVYVTAGRVAFSIQGTDVFSPFDTNQLQQFTKAALAKVQHKMPVQ